jgi:cytochrome b pre-mRNA-processing protein 3
MRRPFKRDPHEGKARALYRDIVAQARRPEFFRDCGVPDNLDGRFDLLVLHVFLVLHRLKRDRDRTADLAQALFDVLFQDMDASLREMGAGDIGVGHRVKKMIEAFYGRVAAYEAALETPGEALQAALARNLFGQEDAGPAALAALAAYVRREVAALGGQETGALLEGEVAFGPGPGPEVPKEP